LNAIFALATAVRNPAMVAWTVSTSIATGFGAGKTAARQEVLLFQFLIFG